MATIWDVTTQHSGWRTSNFATAGWQDWYPQNSVGLKPGSFWISPLNGQRTDVELWRAPASDAAGTELWFRQQISGAVQGALPPTTPVLAAGQHLLVFTRVPQSNQQILVRVAVSDQPVTPAPGTSPCAFGTRAKGSSPLTPILTPDLLDVILAPLGLLWRAIVYAPLQYSPINVERLCSRPPPPLVLDLSVGGLESVVRIQQDLDAVAWPYFCECVPGTPSPVPFPPPSAVQPPSWPTPPTFPCDPADLCGTLSLLRQEVAALRATVGSVYQLATVTQRFGTPFAYIPGALHSGLVGEGELPVPRIVGVHARIVSPPPSKVLEGNPDYWWNQGWMSIGNEQGMLQEQRLSRQDHLWLPDQAPAATRFRWALPSGVVLDLRELYAEP